MAKLSDSERINIANHWQRKTGLALSTSFSGTKQVYINLRVNTIYVPRSSSEESLHFMLGHEIGHIGAAPASISWNKRFYELVRQYYPAYDAQENIASNKIFSILNYLTDPLANWWAVSNAGENRQPTLRGMRKFYKHTKCKDEKCTAIKIHTPAQYLANMMNLFLIWTSRYKQQLTFGTSSTNKLAESLFVLNFISKAHPCVRVEQIIKRLGESGILAHWSKLPASAPKKSAERRYATGAKTSTCFHCDNRDIPSTSLSTPNNGIDGEKMPPDTTDTTLPSLARKMQYDTTNVSPLWERCRAIGVSAFTLADKIEKLKGNKGKKAADDIRWRTRDRVTDLDLKHTVKKFGAIIPGVTTVKRAITQSNMRHGGNKMTGCIYLVLDRSSSMRQLIGAMKIVAFGIAKGAKNSDHDLAVLSFSWDPSFHLAPTKDTQAIRKVISNLECSGGTCLSPALKYVRDHIKKHNRKGTVIVISDYEMPASEHIDSNKMVNEIKHLGGECIGLNISGHHNSDAKWVTPVATVNNLTTAFRKVSARIQKAKKELV